ENGRAACAADCTGRADLEAVHLADAAAASASAAANRRLGASALHWVVCPAARLFLPGGGAGAGRRAAVRPVVGQRLYLYRRGAQLCADVLAGKIRRPKPGAAPGGAEAESPVAAPTADGR